MDGSIPIYHLYYGNADADVGSIATSFPYSRKPGRAGSGQLSCTSYTVPNGAIPFWKEHFDRHQAEHSGVQERFGTKYLRVRHPAGLLFEVIEEAGDHRNPWMTKENHADAATRGFFGAVLSVRDVRDQESFFVDGARVPEGRRRWSLPRFEVPGSGPGRVVDLHVEPERAPGSWGFGAGTATTSHSMSKQTNALVKQKAVYEELGFTDASEIKDRFYFHSMYVRSPGGILVECTANVPGGFFQDEAPEELGTKLHLPPWFEAQREAIRRAAGGDRGAGGKPAPAGDRGGASARRRRCAETDTGVAVPLSRSQAVFDADKQTT